MPLDPNTTWNWDAYSAAARSNPAAVAPAPRRHPISARRKLAVLLALVIASWCALAAVGVLVAHAAAAVTTPRCPVTVTQTHPGIPFNGLHLTVAPSCQTPPLVAVQLWLAPSANGQPLAEQQLLGTAYSGLVTSAGVDVPGIPVYAPDCFAQLDVAYGEGKANLLTPYGADLITAYHQGWDNCFWTPPTVTPPSSAPPAPSSPPASSTPPSSTTPAPTTPVVVPSATQPPSPSATISTTPTVTLAPPTSTTRPPRKAPHPTTPAPTTTKRHAVVPPPSASGCVGTGCDTPTPAPSSPATLPFTGTNMPTGPIVAIAAAGILFGVACLILPAYLRRHPNA